MPLLDHATTIRQITRCCPEAAGAEWRPANAAALTSLPGWAASAGLTADAEGYWLWLEPAPGSPPGSLGQFVLDVSAGRYVVEVFDTEALHWFSRESAAGGPLVAGVPCRCAALVVRIRPAPPRR
jgi:hypothetical protein